MNKNTSVRIAGRVIFMLAAVILSICAAVSTNPAERMGLLGGTSVCVLMVAALRWA